MDIEIIKQVLMSEDEYWVFAIKTTSNNYGRFERGEDQVIFAALPPDVERGLKYEDITLKHIEMFDRLRLDLNIFLGQPYAPFQRGITFHDVYKGFPVKNSRVFIIAALQMESKDYYEYKKLAETFDLVTV
jgi:hypothetical protein